MRKARVIRLFVLALLLIAAVPARAQFKNLFSFYGVGGVGSQPYGSLILIGDSLYGMTTYGEYPEECEVFRFNWKYDQFIRLFIWGGTPYDSLTFQDGLFYGMTCYEGIFRFNADLTIVEHTHRFAGGASDGIHPYGTLIAVNGKLFGMTREGGAGDKGVVFRINPDGTGFKILHSFAGGASDGAYPTGTLIFTAGMLFGMTDNGGPSDLGTIFRIGPGGRGFKILHAFKGGQKDGAIPSRSLAVKDSALYGMTREGGKSDHGTIFKISTAGKGFALLHSFKGAPTGGAGPKGSLLLVGKKLYGMTETGGIHDAGTIFKINRGGTGFQVLHSFENGYPTGSLVFEKDGKVLYGMTPRGGQMDEGTIFSYALK